MSWIEHHEVSERLASDAQAALRQGRKQDAFDLYARAADAEVRALADLDVSKTRTLGISAVSVASLHYKAKQFAQAEEVAVRWLDHEATPTFARKQLRTLLQSIWEEAPDVSGSSPVRNIQPAIGTVDWLSSVPPSPTAPSYLHRDE